MDPASIQKLIVKNREETGQRMASMPQPSQFSPNNDAQINALRNQKSDKLNQLFAHDSQLAQVKFKPQEAAGSHAEGYQAPDEMIVDPMIGLRASNTQTRATAAEIGDINKREAVRKTELDDAMEKSLKLFEYGLKAKELEQNSLFKELSSSIDLERLNMEKAKSKSKYNLTDLIKLFNGQTAPQDDVEGPQYSPKNPNQTVTHNGRLWKFNTKMGQWEQIGQTAQGGPTATSKTSQLETIDPRLLAFLEMYPENGDKVAEKLIEKLLSPESTKAPTATAKARSNLADSGMRALQQLESILLNDPNVLAKNLIPGQPLSRDWSSSAFRAVDALLRLRTGATAPPQEVENYVKNVIPQPGDPPDVIQRKLQQLLLDYQLELTRDPGSYTGNWASGQSNGAVPATGGEWELVSY